MQNQTYVQLLVNFSGRHRIISKSITNRLRQRRNQNRVNSYPMKIITALLSPYTMDQRQPSGLRPVGQYHPTHGVGTLHHNNLIQCNIYLRIRELIVVHNDAGLNQYILLTRHMTLTYLCRQLFIHFGLEYSPIWK